MPRKLVETPKYQYVQQGLSQDLETGCSKLTIVKFLGFQIFKGDHNPYTMSWELYRDEKIQLYA